MSTNKYSHTKNTNLDAIKIKNIKVGKVRQIKEAPEKGKKRIVVREKSTGGKNFSVDMTPKEAKNVKRKETYNFDVVEKKVERVGSSGRMTKAGYKTYHAQGAPEPYTGNEGKSFKDFSGSGRLNGGGRTKFL